MSKRLAPVCRVIQRPHRLAGYITYMQRPGTSYTEVLPGNRRECLRAALEVAANRAEYDARRKSS